MLMSRLPSVVSAMADGGPSRKLSTLRLEVDVVRHGEEWSHAAVTDAMLKRGARAALLSAPPEAQGAYQVIILLTDDAEIKELNRTWRGKDAPTNVLSFPGGDDPTDPRLLGDVVLAYETILQEARDSGIPFADHVQHLVVHGLLHLLGFDHMNDEEAERMENLERTALASIGIADPYAEERARPAEVSP
jgi:probable rRNA maturation factor